MNLCQSMHKIVNELITWPVQIEAGSTRDSNRMFYYITCRYPLRASINPVWMDGC